MTVTLPQIVFSGWRLSGAAVLIPLVQLEAGSYVIQALYQSVKSVAHSVSNEQNGTQYLYVITDCFYSLHCANEVE